MKKIDQYVDSIYKDVAGDKQEIEEFKQEMRSHLIESVEELKAKGKTENEAIDTAIENFGGKNHLLKGLSEFFKVQKKFTYYVFSFTLIFLLLGVLFFGSSTLKVKTIAREIEAMEQEKDTIMNETFKVLSESKEVTEENRNQLWNVFNKYKEELNVLAVIPVSRSNAWLKENERVKDNPTNSSPIAYNKAELVMGNEGEIEDKNHIVPSSYDLGTVIQANDSWIVQYEYQQSYEDTIEKYHQLKYYGPSLWSYYQWSILFLSLFIVLGRISWSLDSQNKQLSDIAR